jgi:cullin 1
MSLVRKQEGERDHSNYTQQLIDLHDQYLMLVQGPFENNQLFQKVLKEAFEVFVNKDIGNTTTAELLSTFCDNIMKTGGDKLEGEIDVNLDKIVMLFSYLSDKDMFAEFYRKQLAKRLLLNRSASDDDERSLITKLKVILRGLSCRCAAIIFALSRIIQCAFKQVCYARGIERYTQFGACDSCVPW